VTPGVERPASVDNEPAVLAQRGAGRREDAADPRVAAREHLVLRLVGEHAGDPRHGAVDRRDPRRGRTPARDRREDVALRLEIGFGAAVSLRRHHAEDARITQSIQVGRRHAPRRLRVRGAGAQHRHERGRAREESIGSADVNTHSRRSYRRTLTQESEECERSGG
jgi:hypothetical protein